MRLLTEQQLAQVSSLDVTIYRALLGVVERESANACLVDDESGFFFAGPETLIDDPYLISLRLCFPPSGGPGLMANFNDRPEGLNFFASDLPGRLGCYDSWPILLTDYPSESAFLAAASAFVSDWLTGQTQVEIATANGVPYKWTVRRRGRELWSHRRFLYPIWGRKTVEIRACGAEAPAGTSGRRNATSKRGRS
jgi:hypothetical protein